MHALSHCDCSNVSLIIYLLRICEKMCCFVVDGQSQSIPDKQTLLTNLNALEKEFASRRDEVTSKPFFSKGWHPSCPHPQTDFALYRHQICHPPTQNHKLLQSGTLNP